MNTKSVLQRSWQMLWRYRALWLFGAILALVAANAIFLGPWGDRVESKQWFNIRISNFTTFRVPSGSDLTIDLTAPDGVRLITPDGASWRGVQDLLDEINRGLPVNIFAVLIEIVVILFVLILLGTIARYVAETAVMRMVNEGEETGKRLSIRQGLRRGFSSRALRLFIVDLVVGILATLAFAVVFGLAFSPLLLVVNNHEPVTIAAGAGGTLFLLALATFLWIAGGAVLSLVMQPVRLACVLEDRSLAASIGVGFRMLKKHLKEVGLLWLIWVGIRILWAPVVILIVVLIAPVFLLSVVAGVVAGGAPAALVGGIAGQFTGGATPWIMGILAGLPIFTLVTISPILFVSGLVEIYKSCLWTLGYRNLKTVEQTAKAPEPKTPLVPVEGAAS